MENQLILNCEASLDGILSAIYEGFIQKNAIIKQYGSYHDNIQISIGDHAQTSLFSSEQYVPTDTDRASKTAQAIQNKLGFHIFNEVFAALCHYDPQRATNVFGFLVRAFSTGPSIYEHLADPFVKRTMELSLKVNNENQRFLGFIRFHDTGDFLFSKIAPKCDLLPMMVDHFSDRYCNENFVIYDEKRDYALIHPAFHTSIFASGDNFFNSLSELEQHSLSSFDNYELLWKGYFQTVAIAERKNPRCQDNMCAKWYRRNMLEFESSL